MIKDDFQKYLGALTDKVLKNKDARYAAGANIDSKSLEPFVRDATKSLAHDVRGFGQKVRQDPTALQEIAGHIFDTARAEWGFTEWWTKEHQERRKPKAPEKKPFEMTDLGARIPPGKPQLKLTPGR